MTDRPYVLISSTSATTADVSPVVLRGGESTDTRRLVFRPRLVENSTDPDASVHGIFIYQRRRADESWEDVRTVRLTDLKGGEGVRLELRAAELLRLHKALGALYAEHSTDGIQPGDRRFVLIDARSGARGLLDAYTNSDNPDSLHAVVEWVNDQDPVAVSKFFRTRDDAVARLDDALGIARLQDFIERADELLLHSSEDDWQQLLKKESWALGQLYAEPLVILDERIYLGGKDVHNRGGSVADFLYKNELSDNCMLVEIKRSDTPLIVEDKTKRNRILNVSRELSGAAQQLLQSRHALTQDYLHLTANEDPRRFQVFSPQMLLVIGSLASLEGPEKQKSFELYRGEQRNLRIVCFDELVQKAKTLLALLRRSH